MENVETRIAPVLNPWTSIWTKPRATIQQIVETDPEKHVLALAAVAGVSSMLDRASIRNAGDEVNLGVILAAALLIGPLGGVIGLYLGAVLLRWTGRWIGGQGSTLNIRAAIAWACVPVVPAVLLWIPELLLAGSDLFTSETPRLDSNPTLALVLLPLLALGFVFGFWGIVLLTKCLGQVQGFSAWKALGNCVLALLVVVVPFVAVAAIVGVLAR